MERVRIEFTVEPFVDGNPGEHVRAAWAAVEAFGYSLDNGPFSAVAVVDSANVGAVTANVVSSALAAGATRVSVQVEREDA
jgi:hypothetical protein